MSFVMLDTKNWCKGIYQEGELHFDKLPEKMTATWKYSSSLENKNIDYASLYANGMTIEQVCPQHLQQEWDLRKKKLSSFHKSFTKAKINLDEVCFYDLVPAQFLLELCDTKTKIIDHVIENFDKPKNYSLLLETEKIIEQISQQKLNIDLSYLRKEVHKNRARTLLSRLNKSLPIVSYNLFGSKTGRLTTRPLTFPILNLDKEYKSVIKPRNDLFIELDFNAAEVRVLLGLSGEEQPQEDIHEWNAKRLNISREEAKKDIFSWLYGSSKVESVKFENLFNLNKIMDSKYDGEYVESLYGRKIKSDSFHSLNYLVQSSTAELVLDQIIKINKILQNKKSFISFIVHDSVVIDLDKEDKNMVQELVDTFSKTKLGNFPVNISMGKDYGNLRKVKC